MVPNTLLFAAVSVALTSQVSAHIAPWHPSMFGFNQSSFPTNRPQDPLAYMPFNEWWMHGHLSLPPHPNDIMQLPAGGDAVVELSCDKGATSWYASAPGGDTRDPQTPDYPCPGAPLAAFHTNGENDLGGCALSVAYKSDANDVQPEDLVIFSVQQKCVWNLHTHFEIPADMPPCPNGKCICAWHWIHLQDSGSEQMYMNGFQCNFTGATSTKQLAEPKVARRCGAEGDLPARPWNCTYGAKSPLFWLQNERNNMFEGYYDPPVYQDKYNFRDGAQNDIFTDGIVTTPLPPSSAGQSTSSSALNILTQTSSPSSPTPSLSPTPSSSLTPSPSSSPTPSPSSTPSSSPTPSPSSTPSSSPTPSPSSAPSSSPTPSPSSTPSSSPTPSPSSTPSSSPTPVTHSQSTTSTKPETVPNSVYTSLIHAPKPSQSYGSNSGHHHKHKHTSGGSCRARSKYSKRLAPLANREVDSSE